MDRTELQKLRDLPIEGVAERLGLRVVRHKSLCPFHDDHHASLSFRVSKNTYRCFVCGASGGTIDLVMRHLHKDFKEACRWLADGTPLQLPRGGEQEPVQTTSPSGEDGRGVSRFERFFERPWLNEEARKFLFDERRLDPRVVRWCRLTSWKDRQGIPWLQIPYYDREGRLIGVQNRNLNYHHPTPDPILPSPSGEGPGVRLPRFRFPQGSQCSIYNLPVLNLLKPGDELYIAEGCSDCWSLLSAGHKAIAIPSATLLSRKDIELLRSLCSSPSGEAGRGFSFHMYPDRDAPGERLFLQLQQALPSLVHHQLPPGCKDFSEYYLATKKS
jgi:DNA primase